jgi:hypothetical protein
MLIDFGVPCEPDVHAMPPHVQEAGRIIRREIMRLYAAMRECERNANAYRRSSNHAFRAAGDRRAAQADEARGKYRALFEAYHAWSGTAISATPFHADPALLAEVCAKETA